MLIKSLSLILNMVCSYVWAMVVQVFCPSFDTNKLSDILTSLSLATIWTASGLSLSFCATFCLIEPTLSLLWAWRNKHTRITGSHSYNSLTTISITVIVQEFCQSA